MSRRDRPDMLILSIAVAIAVFWLIHSQLPPSGDGPRQTPSNVPTIVIPGAIMTATPPTYAVYLEEVKR